MADSKEDVNLLQKSTETEAQWKTRVSTNADGLTATQITELQAVSTQPAIARYHQNP